MAGNWVHSPGFLVAVAKGNWERSSGPGSHCLGRQIAQRRRLLSVAGVFRSSAVLRIQSVSLPNSAVLKAVDFLFPL